MALRHISPLVSHGLVMDMCSQGPYCQLILFIYFPEFITQCLCGCGCARAALNAPSQMSLAPGGPVPQLEAGHCLNGPCVSWGGFWGKIKHDISEM